MWATVQVVYSVIVSFFLRMACCAQSNVDVLAEDEAEGVQLHPLRIICTMNAV